MLTTSAAFKTAIASEDREIRAYLRFNGSTILRGVDGLVSIEWDQSVYDEERLCIGCAVSSFITAEFFDNLTGVDFKNSYVEAFVGVVLEDTGTAPSGSIEPDTATVEYVSLGRFDITDSVTKNGKTVITAYDKLSKLSGEYTPSISAGTNGYAIADIVNDVLTQSGVGGSVSGSYGYVQKIQASTYREQLKYCLTMMVQNGSSYILDRTNDSLKMTSVIGQDATQLTITDSTTYIDGMDEQPSFTISSLQATTGTDVYTFGNGQGIEISNPYITNAQASAIYNSMEGFSYLPIRLEFRGNPAIDPGDVLALTAGGKNTKIVAMRIRSTFNGGFKSTIDCYGNTETYYAMSESPTRTRITQAENMIRLEAARATAAEGGLSSLIDINAEGISLVSEKLNNIGGRNILLNSATAHWQLINNATATFSDGQAVNEWLTSEAIRVTGTGGITAAFAQLFNTSQTDAVYRAGTNYMMSVYIKNNHPSTTLILSANGGETQTSIAPGEIKRATATAVGDGTTALRMRLSTETAGQAVDFYYWHPQIEYGEVVTSWNPAPEDVEGAIAANSAAIQVNATNIASKVSQTDYNGDTIASLINQTSTSVQIQASKVDLQGYVTFSNLSTSGQTAINGGNITTNTISADKLSITDLNAIGATIGGFKIEANSIHTNGVAITSNATDSVGLSSSTFTRTINGTSRSSLKFAIGSNFGVANDGTLYASNGNFTGTITSNNATITGGSLTISGTTTFSASDYSQTDITAVNNIILHIAEPTAADYEKYDINRDGIIDIFDLVGIRNMVNGSSSSESATVTAKIDPNSSNGIFHIWSTGTGESGGTFGTAGLLSTNTFKAGNYSLTKEGVYVGENNAVTGLLRSSGLYYFYSDASNQMSLAPDEGLDFRDSSGNVTAQYPNYGPAIRSTKTLTSGSSVKITFAAESVAIISAIGYLGNAYGVFLYTGYALGSARQHITKLLGDAAVSMTINESDQSVTLSYTGAATMYVSALPLYGNPPTFS